MNFQELELELVYKNLLNNLVDEFYNPLLRHATQYDRAVGYFTSGSLLLMVDGLKAFIKNEGRIRLVISPFILEEDFKVIKNGDTAIQKHIETIFKRFEEDPHELEGAQLLWLLMQKGILSIKVAIPRNKRGMFHEKIGLLHDSERNIISFAGSNNETRNAILYNYESFNTYRSWIPGQDLYIKHHQINFESYWSQTSLELDVIDIHDAVSQNFLERFASEKELEDYNRPQKVKQPTEPPIINEPPVSDDTLPPRKTKSTFTPFKHQIEGAKRWLENKKGILKYATGAGKTKTAILIVERLKEIESKLFTIFVVPDKTMVNQWHDELISYGWDSLRCFSDEYKWDETLAKKIIELRYEDDYHSSVVVTNDTFFGPKFQYELKKLKNNFALIVDECHTWGTERILGNLPAAKMRLGLSATPEIHFFPDKTERLFSYFGGIIHEYDLSQALKDKRLVPYEYKPIRVYLTEDERAAYDDLTLKIVKMLGRDADEYKQGFPIQAEMLLFKRARIIYGARNKLDVLSERVREFTGGGNALIYCGPASYSHENESDVDATSQTQLEAVNDILEENGLKFAQYTSKESEKERIDALNSFKRGTYSILNAIKCLDEGIDIPQIEKAVILASSTNPREFIQRRGRILRPNAGKEKAIIYDFLVMEEGYESLMKKEIERLNEFAQLATNKKEILDEFDYEIDLYLREEDDGKK